MPPKTKKLNTLAEVEQAGRVLLSEHGLDFSNGDYVPVPRSHKSAVADSAALAINYHDVNGAPTDFYRLRLLEQPKPRPGEEKQKALRYAQPKGTRPQAYFPKFNFTEFFSKPPHDRELTITEGEFKADAAVKRGIPCIAIGGVWNYLTKTEEEKDSVLLPELKRLKWDGMRVIICYDSDAVNNNDVDHARDGLCERLEALGAKLFVRHLPQLKGSEKTGLDDFLLLKGPKEWHKLPLERWYGPNVPQLVARPMDDFLKYKYVEQEEMLKSPAGCLLRHPNMVQIHAFRGVGKTNVALLLAGALTRQDGEFFRWHTVRPMRVLYVEGEQPSAAIQRRVKLQVEQTTPNLHVMTLDDQPNFNFPKIVTPEGQKAFERYIEEHKIQVLFLDSLSTLANIDMNDEKNQLVLCDWFLRLRTSLRVTLVYLQHDGKGGNQRGHSKHEDWLDLSIHLTWPKNYFGAEGLRAFLKFDKAKEPVKDGQRLRIKFGSALEDPNRSKWTFEQVTEEQEKLEEDGLLTAACMLLARKRDMSANEMETELRSQGHTGDHTKFRDAFKQAKKLRAQGDAVSKAAKGKVPKY